MKDFPTLTPNVAMSFEEMLKQPRDTVVIAEVGKILDLLATQKSEMIKKVEEVMDKDRAKEICDNIEMAYGTRDCAVCGYNPEHQREYLLKKLKEL